MGTHKEFEMRSHPSRVLLLALLLLFASCSGKKEGSSDVGSESLTDDSGSIQVAESATEAKDNLDDRIDLLVAEAAKLPRAEFDPAARAIALGNDAQKHFEWVRDNTSWAPYRGLLRGSRGVMLDRVGSNLDRAVLLGDLLRHAGYTVRLAHAELTETSARELLPRLRPTPTERRATVGPKPELGKDLEQHIARSQEVVTDAEALVRSQTEGLLAAVRDAASQNRDDERDSIAALRDHWWVEQQEGDKWIAMDPLLPNAKPGEVLAAASSRAGWPAQAGAPTIPESEWHTVRVQVVVERYEAGNTSEATALEALLRPADLLERPVTLSHIPMPWPAELPDLATDSQPYREAALAVKEWVPVLRIGRDHNIQSGFTIAGDIDTTLAETLSGIRKGDMSKLGGIQVAGGMDMALGGFSPEEAVPAATAEWIDYEIRVPGAPIQNLRRPVFDLLGPARRAAKVADFDGTADLRKLERFDALWSQTNILLQPCEFTSEFVAHLASASVLAEEKALRDLARETDPAKAQEFAAELFGRLDIWGPLPHLALWRSALGGQQSEWFVDRPNVLNYRGGISVLKSDQVTYRELIDVASNSTGTRLGTGVKPFEVRVRQGVIDTVAEMLALGSELGAAENTASVFARLAAENSRGFLIAPRDQAAVKALPWPEDEGARVGADIEAGYMVVVPRQAVIVDGEPHVGWWRVHPATGETIGVMDSGFHAGKVESAIITGGVSLAALFPFLARPDNAQRLQAMYRAMERHPQIRFGAADERLLKMAQIAHSLSGDIMFLATGRR